MLLLRSIVVIFLCHDNTVSSILICLHLSHLYSPVNHLHEKIATACFTLISSLASLASINAMNDFFKNSISSFIICKQQDYTSRYSEFSSLSHLSYRFFITASVLHHRQIILLKRTSDARGLSIFYFFLRNLRRSINFPKSLFFYQEIFFYFKRRFKTENSVLRCCSFNFQMYKHICQQNSQYFVIKKVTVVAIADSFLLHCYSRRFRQLYGVFNETRQ